MYKFKNQLTIATLVFGLVFTMASLVIAFVWSAITNQANIFWIPAMIGGLCYGFFAVYRMFSDEY